MTAVVIRAASPSSVQGELAMRMSSLVLSCILAFAAACATSDTPAIDTEPAALAASCPGICGDETPCRTAAGVCTFACNPCLCQAAGGTVDTACRAGADEAPAAEPVSEPDDDAVAVPDLVIGQCGPTVCGAGTVCCNSSCGVCTVPGGKCTEQICNPTE
jgi:hypothetical protein